MSSLTNRGKLPKVVPPAPQPRTELGAQQLFPNTNVEIDIRPPFELQPRFTGRREVLTALEESFATSLDRSTLGFALLVGEAGMGKSRTLREFVDVIEDLEPDVRVLVGNCKSSDKTYAAMAMLLSARFGIVASDSDAVAHEKIEAGIVEVMNPSRVTEVSHLLAHLMRRPYPNSQVVAPIAHSHQQLEVRTFLALKRFCQADALAGPLVMCFENLEQADSATINLLHFLVSGLSSSRVMVVGTATARALRGLPAFRRHRCRSRDLRTRAAQRSRERVARFSSCVARSPRFRAAWWPARRQAGRFPPRHF